MQKLNILIYGDGNPYHTLESLKDLNVRVFLQSFDFDHDTANIIPEVIIESHRLLHMLTVISIHEDPVCILYAGNEVNALKLPFSIDKVLIPKNTEVLGKEYPINLSGVIFPMSIIRQYMNMCKASGIFDGDEETLFKYSKKLMGTKEYDCGFITKLDHEKVGGNNNDKLSGYFKRHPKELKYE